MSVSTRMHPFIQSYAQEQIEHWPWWETFRIMWNWAKQKCSSPRRAVPHTPYAVDAGTHKTVKTCVTLTGTLMTLRAAIHPSSCVRALARTCLSIWQSLAPPISSRTPVRVVCLRLKQIASSRHLRRVRATKIAAWESWGQAKWKQKADWKPEDPPNHRGGTWNAEPGSQTRWETYPVPGWSQSWRKYGTEPAASSNSEDWQFVRSEAAGSSSKAADEDPWIYADPWKSSTAWSTQGSPRCSEDGKYGQLDTQQFVFTSHANDSQLDTQQSVDTSPPCSLRTTPYGTVPPPPFTTFGPAANRKQNTAKTIEPQWKEGQLFKKMASCQKGSARQGAAAKDTNSQRRFDRQWKLSEAVA